MSAGSHNVHPLQHSCSVLTLFTSVRFCYQALSTSCMPSDKKAVLCALPCVVLCWRGEQLAEEPKTTGNMSWHNVACQNCFWPETKGLVQFWVLLRWTKNNPYWTSGSQDDGVSIVWPDWYGCNKSTEGVGPKALWWSVTGKWSCYSLDQRQIKSIPSKTVSQ